MLTAQYKMNPKETKSTGSSQTRAHTVKLLQRAENSGLYRLKSLVLLNKYLL